MVQQRNVRIGLAIFGVLICWLNRINQKRFDKTLFFLPFPAAGRISKCFGLWLLSVMALQASLFQSLRWRSWRNGEANCLKSLKKSLSKLSAECCDLVKGLTSLKGNCQGTGNGDRETGQVHICSWYVCGHLTDQKPQFCSRVL